MDDIETIVRQVAGEISSALGQLSPVVAAVVVVLTILGLLKLLEAVRS